MEHNKRSATGVGLKSRSALIKNRDFLPLFLALVFKTGNSNIHVESFVKTTDVNGTVMCATEEPSLVFESHQLSVQSTGATCVPLEIYCAWKCSLEPNCTNFNYREDVKRCELFFYSPSNHTSIQFCSHEQANTHAVIIQLF